MNEPGFSIEGLDDRGWLVIHVDGELFTADEIARFLDWLLAKPTSARDA